MLLRGLLKKCATQTREEDTATENLNKLHAEAIIENRIYHKHIPILHNEQNLADLVAIGVPLIMLSCSLSLIISLHWWNHLYNFQVEAVN